MHKFATICLAGALCFSFSGIRAEASSLSLAEEGIASVMTEAQTADPDADEKVLEDMTPSEFEGVCIAKVNDYVNVRSEANTDSSVLTQVIKGEELEYVETLDGWIKVTIDDEDAYVASEYVEVKDILDTAITMTELLYGEGVSDVRVDLVEYAKQFVGNPYVWGGTSLTKGADCSGFVLSVFKKYGMTLSHSSRAQANEGTKISASELKPGDLIFYGSSVKSINHVAIYIGGGQVVHASSPSTGIRISKYNYRTPVKYVRIIQD